MKKVALFTMAVGADRIYFDSVARYFSYNKKYFGQDNEVDYYLFTDREEEIEGIINIPCKTTVWPYTTMLKNNFISDYLDSSHKWDYYDYIFFIDADFAIGDKHDFFKDNFTLVKPYWNEKNGGGFFYGGKSAYFKILCNTFYNELKYIYENKLSLPRDLDEYYLGLFRKEYSNDIHIIEMEKEKNTLIFFDNENLDEKIEEKGNKLFMQPYKAEGRANKTIILDTNYKELECIVNLKEQYIFNNYTYDFGRLVPLDEENYRILWAKEPEKREVLNIATNRISEKIMPAKSAYPSPVISIIMLVCNTPKEYLEISIESILNQTLSDFELIIINDGSTDTSCIEFIKTYKDSRIRLIENRHDYIDSLNKGVNESKGRYLVRMEAGNRMVPHTLKIQYEFMEDYPEIDVCGSWVELFGSENGKLTLKEKHEDILTSLLTYNIFMHSCVIMRNTVFRKKEPLYEQDYLFAEDYRLWTVLALNGYRFANIPKVLLYSRVEDKQSLLENLQQRNTSIANIQREYTEEITDLLVQEKTEFLSLLETTFNLYNEDKISFNAIKNIVSSVFTDYLNAKKER